MAPLAGWYRDPFGRNEYRYFDGTSWTAHVATAGSQGEDSPMWTPGRKRRGPLLTLIGCGGALFLGLVALIGSVIIAGPYRDDGPPSPRPEVTSPEVTSGGPAAPVIPPTPPTAEAPPTDGVDAAVLGGSVAAFDRELGPRAAPGSPGTEFAIHTYLGCEGRNRPQLSVGFLYGAASSINYGPCRERRLVSVDEAEREASRYFPPDTKRVGDTTTQDGEPARVFRSPVLASAYDDRAPQFRDCEGDSVPPGTFILVITGNDWWMSPGTCP